MTSSSTKGIRLESGDVSLIIDSESPVSLAASSFSLKKFSFPLPNDLGLSDRRRVDWFCCFRGDDGDIRLLRLAMTSPLALVVVSLLMTNTLEFSINFPFSNVIDVRTGEFCTKIFVFGKPVQLLLFVTWRVIDPLEFEFGIMALLDSSNDVDLIPFEDVDVVTFVEVPLDLISLCLVEFFGDPCVCATVADEPCAESKLE